ncbi:MAG: glutathione S-transferase family protein [Alphaproteobacteria bacterium]|nr:glutathione S-transferase family protein [Alphaproteobacteria bacterium]MBU6471858.1 glutathione S-transferase family protein [Alphaproteobacteria bacterium]MDE2074414.1 glutathione S-transferase family protein [Alphaproteobacteria bacterium]MDE2350735.1 glutathione S-transferase family protein [Alphaproteobacteria bacterium]
MATQYRLIIGTRNWSSWSLRPYLALRATGAKFDEVVIGLDRPQTKAEILAQSPAGRVPVLKITEAGETTTVFDSLAICETLADRFPQAGLWPQDWRTRALARSYAAEMHSGFAALRTALPMEIARTLPQPQLSDAVKADIARIVDAWTDALTRYGKDGGFLFGRFSVADCMYGPVVTRFRTYDIALPKIVDAYCTRMMALPAMQDWLTEAQKEVAGGLKRPQA